MLKDISLQTALDLMLEPLGLGWVVRNDVLVVSKDGKILTATIKGSDQEGPPFNNVMVYDKQ